MSQDEMNECSLLDLFREEADTQTQILTTGLLALERDHTLADQLEACMRAAHSLKGAAGLVDLAVAVRVAHTMEDCFVAAQHGRVALGPPHIDALLQGTDLLTRIAHTPAAGVARWAGAPPSEVDAWAASLDGLCTDEGTESSREDRLPAGPMAKPSPTTPPDRQDPNASGIEGDSDRMLRVTADHLNRLLSLAGESLVESRSVRPFADLLLRLKRMHHAVGRALDLARNTSTDRPLNDPADVALADARRLVVECEQFLAERLTELDTFDRRGINLAHRLYGEALACRMRPFADGVEGLPRVVRDLARSLGKQVRLEISGGDTQVDRDILAALEAPLSHLLRNAVDHGIEPPAVRLTAGKPAEGLIRVEARHFAGALQISVSDDGFGIDVEHVREVVVARNLATREVVLGLTEAEVLAFLFLPGFTTKGAVTDLSGRGVGLDVVHEMVRQVQGTVRVSSQVGKSTRFDLQLPVTLSVVRTLLAEIAGEPYAFPLAYIVRALKLPSQECHRLEGREHFELGGRHIGLVSARQVLAAETEAPTQDELSVIVMGNNDHTYGLVVDRFLGERDLVVQVLDPQLGKIQNIAAAALMEDGFPVLIVDAEDMIRSMDRLASGGQLTSVQRRTAHPIETRAKRVLVVDDSLTVRELERKVLGSAGYEVEVAVDGVDGWNAVRTGHFNLVITDIDMPRMDGIELVIKINGDPHVKPVPVMIVSYKDREEDRRRGLEAGATHYLTKASFHDETLLQAVVDLIGAPGL